MRTAEAVARENASVLKFCRDWFGRARPELLSGWFVSVDERVYPRSAQLWPCVLARTAVAIMESHVTNRSYPMSPCAVSLCVRVCFGTTCLGWFVFSSAAPDPHSPLFTSSQILQAVH